MKYSLKICIGRPLDSIYENIIEINLDHLNISNCEYLRTKFLTRRRIDINRFGGEFQMENEYEKGYIRPVFQLTARFVMDFYISQFQSDAF